MEIEISEHTLSRAQERGTNELEIKDVIENGNEVPAKESRKGKEKVYAFDNDWKGKYYPEKLVRVFFVVGEKIISTVTVIVQFGKWTKN